MSVYNCLSTLRISIPRTDWNEFVFGIKVWLDGRFNFAFCLSSFNILNVVRFDAFVFFIFSRIFDSFVCYICGVELLRRWLWRLLIGSKKSSNRLNAIQLGRMKGMSNDNFHIFFLDLVFIAALPFNTYREHGETWSCSKWFIIYRKCFISISQNVRMMIITSCNFIW